MNRLWTTEIRKMSVDVEGGVDAYFFRTVKSDCNAFTLSEIDTTHPMRI